METFGRKSLSKCVVFSYEKRKNIGILVDMCRSLIDIIIIGYKMNFYKVFLFIFIPAPSPGTESETQTAMDELPLPGLANLVNSVL